MKSRRATTLKRGYSTPCNNSAAGATCLRIGKEKFHMEYTVTKIRRRRLAVAALKRVLHTEVLSLRCGWQVGLMALLVLALCAPPAGATEPGFRPGVYVGGTGLPPQFVFT